MTDRQTAYSISLFGSNQGDDRQDGTSPSRIQQALVDFVMDFHLDNVFVYRYVESIVFYTMTNILQETKFARMCWSNNTIVTSTSLILYPMTKN